MKNRYLFFIITFLWVGLLKSQYVNREFQVSSGHPNFNPSINIYGGYYSKTINSAGGGIIVVGHTNSNSQGENLFLKRVDEDGTILFTKEFNTIGTSHNEYATDVFENPSNGDIYVSGVTDNGGTTNFDGILLCYGSNGAIKDSAVYSGASGLNDIITAVKLNPITGNINVAISNENSTSSYDYVAAEYQTNLALLGQSTPYDYASSGLPDVPFDMTFDAGGHVILIGASANSITDWDFTSVSFSVTNLAFMHDDRVNVPGFGYDQPAAFCRDPSTGDIYVTGRSSSNGTNYDVRTVKIAGNLSGVVWSVAYDANGLEDAGTSITLDNNGDVLVGGFCTNNQGKKEMFWRKYNGSSGATIWTLQQPSINNSGNAFVKTIYLNSNSNLMYFVASEVGSNNQTQTRLGQVYSNGKRGWQKVISETSGDMHPSDLEINNNDIYVITVLDAATNDYKTSKFTEMRFDTTKAYDNNGKPCWKAKELIVGFNPTAINKNFIDNQIGTSEASAGFLSDFLTPAAYDVFVTAFGELLIDQQIKTAKIYHTMKTTDTVAVTRLGQYVPIPAFWADLLIQFPDNLSIQQAQTYMSNIPEVVSYSHPNFFTQTLSPPNDSLYPQQLCLHPSTPVPNGHVNVEEAWNIVPSGGNSFLNCAVFDTNVHWQHPDFGYNGNSGSSKVSGHIFDSLGFSPLPLINTAVPDSNGHGTSCAGLIGAIRNNSIGIAGVCGGNWQNQNKGCGILSYNSVDNITIAAILNMIYYASITFFGDKVHFENHSWAITAANWASQDITALSQQVRFTNRMQIPFIVGRGNFGENKPFFPATYDSLWVISVGGSNSAGNYKDAITEHPGWAANYGSGMDIIAPAVPNLIWTTGVPGVTVPYGLFWGTSAAAPIVSGAVGLMLSYYNDTLGADNYRNLSPDDCDFILGKTATDVGAIGYDSLSGHGRLNIGKALKMIEKPFNQLYHYGTNSLTPHTITKSLYSTGDVIELTEFYQTPFPPQQNYPAGLYKVNTYQINATVNHPATYPSDSIRYIWPRNSSSYVYPLFNAQNKINMHEQVQIVSTSLSSTNLKGYIYQVFDTGNTFLGWWPCDTSFNQVYQPLYGFPNTLMEFSLLTKNKAVGIKENTKEKEVIKLYPNPATNSQTIFIESEKDQNCSIELYDVMGRLIQVVYNGKIKQGINTINNSLDKLANTVYFYIVKLDENTITKKFIKN